MVFDNHDFDMRLIFIYLLFIDVLHAFLQLLNFHKVFLEMAVVQVVPAPATAASEPIEKLKMYSQLFEFGYCGHIDISFRFVVQRNDTIN